MRHTTVAQTTWETLEKHPVLFVPKILGVALSAIWFYIIWNLWRFIEISGLSAGTAEITQLMLVALYLLFEGIIIFYFTTLGYSLYQQKVHHTKEDIKKALSFAHDTFLHISGLSLFLYGALGIPIVAMILIFLAGNFGPINGFISAFYIAALVVWILIMSWRLLVSIPNLTKKAQQPHLLVSSRHFAQTHLRHTVMSWIVVVALATLYTLSDKLIGVQQAVDIWLISIAALLIVTIEILVSVWEHIVLFQLYIQEKKVKHKSAPKKKK